MPTDGAITTICDETAFLKHNIFSKSKNDEFCHNILSRGQIEIHQEGELSS